MAIGDGIRRNVSGISAEERYRLIYAFLALDTTKFYPDGVSYWDKQEDIHKDAHAGGEDVHFGPAFLPWHREICNRLEDLLREVDPALSLHYWDWTTDPTSEAAGAAPLFTNEFMGSPNGDAGFPLQNFESSEGVEIDNGHDIIWRDVIDGPPVVPSDEVIKTTGNGLPELPHPNRQYPEMDAALKAAHGYAHSNYIRGSIGHPHYSFHDPFVFLLHSNVDRLWAMWQLAPGREWRLDPNQVYGTDGSADSINDALEPWSGTTRLVPWDTQPVLKNCKDPSVVAPPLYDFNAREQADWRWCRKCQGLFFGGNPDSRCPAGGAHDPAGSGNYSLVQDTPAAHGQPQWRWCRKCQGLFFGENPGSVCPAGGTHDPTGSGNYSLAHNVPPSPFQSRWRWCHRCQGLFFGGNPGSDCPAGGAHHSMGSGNYSLWHNAPAAHGQANWRWCRKCQGLFFGGNPGSRCPVGGEHDPTGSGDYTLVNNIPAAPGQADWRWCRKCQGLFFGGNPGSQCPAGGTHDSTGSGDYTLLHNIPPAPDQSNWRWCRKCQGLFFGGNPGSVCPAGDEHDPSRSGDYGLMQV